MFSPLWLWCLDQGSNSPSVTLRVEHIGVLVRGVVAFPLGRSSAGRLAAAVASCFRVFSVRAAESWKRVFCDSKLDGLLETPLLLFVVFLG